MSKVYISNNLGKVGNKIAGYCGGRICRISHVEGSRRRSGYKDDKVYVPSTKSGLNTKYNKNQSNNKNML